MKKGITAISVAIIIVIIFILLGTITVSLYNSVLNAKKIVFALEVSNIQEEVNKYMENAEEDDYPVLNDVFSVDISTLTAESIGQFTSETRDGNGYVTLYELDLPLLGIEDVQYGKKLRPKDVYVFSKETGNVYYLEGIKFGNKTYYTLTDELIEIRDKNNKMDQDVSVAVEKPVIDTDGAVVKTLSDGKEDIYISNINIKGNDIKVAKYEKEIIEEELASEYFNTNGTSIISDRIKLPEYLPITLYVENGKGEYDIKYRGYPKIPEGFIASDLEDEDEVSEGLVIYEGLDKVSTDEDALSTRNQFVWIPVQDIDEFIQRDGYANGTLQDYASGNKVVEPNTKKYTGVSPEVTLSVSNDLTGEFAEHAKMIESVEKYGGFYIGRYEAGTSNQRDANNANGTSLNANGNPDVWVAKGKYSYHDVGWGKNMVDVESDVIDQASRNQGYGAVKLSRGMYPENNDNYGAVSTLVYGKQWDAAVNFMKYVDNPNVEGAKYIQDSTLMGWYKDNYSKNNKNRLTGQDGVDGVTVNKVKNVYDMAGNVVEYTMEAASTNGSNWNFRVGRGGRYAASSIAEPMSVRFLCGPNACYATYGFRIALYIK